MRPFGTTDWHTHTRPYSIRHELAASFSRAASHWRVFGRPGGEIHRYRSNPWPVAAAAAATRALALAISCHLSPNTRHICLAFHFRVVSKLLRVQRRADGCLGMEPSVCTSGLMWHRLHYHNDHPHAHIHIHTLTHSVTQAYTYIDTHMLAHPTYTHTFAHSCTDSHR